MIESYQEEAALLPAAPPGQSFAVVGGIYDDGIALIFNGTAQESLKHYKCNASIPFKVGQRVRIIEDSGTYVVEYPVGAPSTVLDADTAIRAAYATEAGYAQTAGSAATAQTAAQATTAGTATVAQKAENADLAVNARAAEVAETATTAKDAETAKTALSVDNTDLGYADIEFRAPYTNQLQYRIKGQTQWNTLQNG